MTQILKFQKIADFFQLGNLISDPKRITGGDLNTNWKIQTSDGHFVIKELNPKIAQKDEICEQYQFTEEVAAFFKSQGIPAVTSLTQNGGRVYQNVHGIFLAYPYIDGVSLETISEEASQEIAHVFYNLHHPLLDIPKFARLSKNDFEFPSLQKWEQLIGRSNLLSLKHLLPIIEMFEERIAKAIPALKSEQVISHRDLHPWNVLWNAGRPHIIDWECAGMVNPIQETVGYFLEWANIMSSEFVEVRFTTMMKTYFSRPLKFQTSLVDGFYGWIAFSPLLWTFFNIERSIDDSISQEERQRGKALLENQLVSAIKFISDQELKILSRLRDLEQKKP